MQSILDTHNELLFAENDVLSATFVRLSQLKQPHAQRYLREGFLSRLLMMRKASGFIYLKTYQQGDEPLSGNTATDLMMHLNSYYYNLPGAFDNLAWALTYELELLGNVQEEGGKGTSRIFVNLFGDKFLDALEEKRPQIVPMLKQYLDWNRDIKELRDPGAHRIPLRFVGGFIDKNDNEELNSLHEQRKQKMMEYEEISKQQGEALSEGKMDDFLALIASANDLLDEVLNLQSNVEKVGVFAPTIITSDASGHELRSAPDQLEQDQRNFLSIARLILTEGF